MLLHEAADWLEENREQLVERVARKIFNIVKTYRDGGMPIKESRQTMESVLGYIIDFLRDKQVQINNEDGYSIGELIKYEDGIASRRVVYAINLEDLLKAIRIFRDEIWNLLASKFGDKDFSSGEFFKLEKRINVFINYLTAQIASAYNKSLADFIGIQASDLMKWEEVIKSASSIELKIPCRGEFAAIVRLQAEAIARRLKYSEEEIQDIKVAVGEVCDNSIEHGKSEKGIDVHYHLSPKEMVIEVIDYGCGFDPKGRGDEPPDPFSERGRGLFLMKYLMDRVEIYSKPGEGTMSILAKKRFYR